LEGSIGFHSEERSLTEGTKSCGARRIKALADHNGAPVQRMMINADVAPSASSGECSGF